MTTYPQPTCSCWLDRAALRRAALAVSVLFDLDLQVTDQGVLLTGAEPAVVPWLWLHQGLAGHHPSDPLGWRQLHTALRGYRWSARLGAPELLRRLRLMGLPSGHALHPGPQWVHRRVLGGALDLGLGILGLDPGQPERVRPLPVGALPRGPALRRAAALAADRLEVLGALSAQRMRRDGTGALRPMGEADVATLLGSATLRSALAGPQGGLTTAMVPTLDQGWTGLRLADPAFGPPVGLLAPAEQRGFPRPLLLTAAEVVLVADGGRATALLLRDPAYRRPALAGRR